MYAAVVTTFDAAPSYQEFPAPTPKDSDEVLVDVVTPGLHRRVRSQADGSHYTSTGDLPLVPGVDGVGRMPDGTLRYFALGDTTSGDGRADGNRPAPEFRAARGHRPGVGGRGILAELPALVADIASGALRIDARAVPLRDVASAWQDTGSAERIVLTP